MFFSRNVGIYLRVSVVTQNNNIVIVTTMGTSDFSCVNCVVFKKPASSTNYIAMDDVMINELEAI